MRKKGKFEKTEKFAIRIKEIYKEPKAALKKSQKEMRKYIDRKRSKVEEY